MGLVDRAIEFLQILRAEQQKRSDAAAAEVESEAPLGNRLDEVQQSLLVEAVAQVEFYKRRSEEYFDVIRRIEAQRQEWRALFERDSTGHQVAQDMLQGALENTRIQLGRALGMINKMRKDAGMAPVADLSKLDPKAYPYGIADETKRQNEKISAEIPVQIDGKAECEALDAKRGPAPAVADLAYTR